MTSMPAVHAATRAQVLSELAAEHFAANPGKLWIPNAIPRNNNIGFEYSSLEQAFPNVAQPWQPLGSLVMVQIRQPLRRTQGGLTLDSDARQTDHDNTQVARVVSLGPLAFRSRDTGAMWPEGAWCAVGDFVRVPKYQGDRSVVQVEVDEEFFDEDVGRRVTHRVKDNVVFVAFKDLAILGKYETPDAALVERAFL